MQECLSKQDCSFGQIVHLDGDDDLQRRWTHYKARGEPAATLESGDNEQDRR